MSDNVVDAAVEELSPRQIEFLHALVEYPSQKEACAAIGIHRDTAHTWMRQTAMKERYADLKQELLNEATGSLIARMQAAVQVVDTVMSDAKVNPYTRTFAAKIIIEQGSELYRMHNLEGKILELEDLARKLGRL